MSNDRIAVIFRKAVLNGTIIKPKYCERCEKKIERQYLDGHHDDYSKPFEVRWLCKSCHNFIEHQLGHLLRFEKGYDSRRPNNSEFYKKMRLKQIKQMEGKWSMRGFEKCIECKTKNRKHYAKGLCAYCYRKRYKLKQA